MNKCPKCGRRLWLRRDCPGCRSQAQANSAPIADDDGFDSTGFAIGLSTGMPISPVHGISAGSILGAALHQSTHPAAPEPSPSTPDTCSPSYTDTGSCGSSSSDFSSSSSDTGSSF